MKTQKRLLKSKSGKIREINTIIYDDNKEYLLNKRNRWAQEIDNELFNKVKELNKEATIEFCQKILKENNVEGNIQSDIDTSKRDKGIIDAEFGKIVWNKIEPK